MSDMFGYNSITLLKFIKVLKLLDILEKGHRLRYYYKDGEFGLEFYYTPGIEDDTY